MILERYRLSLVVRLAVMVMLLIPSIAVHGQTFPARESAIQQRGSQPRPVGNPPITPLPEQVLPDADGDGIADQFDRCPGTPSGTAVNSHGCPTDRDGDGVPDDRDKELITPTYCQPVDADGVGKCPVGGCSEISCSIAIPVGTLSFSDNDIHLSNPMQSQLAVLAAQMQAGPHCTVVVMVEGGGSKAAQQRSWDRVNAVIGHMTARHNIDRNRFVFRYDGGASPGSVMYRAAADNEEGDSNVAPPHPNLRRD